MSGTPAPRHIHGDLGAPDEDRGDPRKWFIFASVSVGTFMCTLDAGIVNIALPSISKALNMDALLVQWVLVIYLLAITSLLLLFGRVADVVGKKRVYTVGMILFAAGSGLSGLAQTPWHLLVTRAVQGVGAAMVMAIGPAIVTEIFPARERGKALGMNSTVVSIGLLTGPALGGAVIAALSWRAVFFLNVPIGVLGVIAVVMYLHSHPASGRQRFDVGGFATFFVCITALTVALNRGRELGWGSPTILGLFGLSLLALALFIYIEKHVSSPMVDLGLFRVRAFSAAIASSYLSFIATAGTAFLLPFFLSQVARLDPAQSGLVLTTQPILVASLAIASGWLSDRIGSRLLASLGLALVSLGLFMFSQLGPDPTAQDLVLRLAVVGLGIGVFQSPNNNTIMSSVPRTRLGIGSGMLAFTRNLGMVTGTAVLGAIWAGRTASYAAAGDPGSTLFGFRDAFLVAAVLVGLGVVTSLVRGRRVAALEPGPEWPVAAPTEG